MCPSYMVTREEKHSTRGRARLLNEMMRGDVVKDGWRDEAVREALDLCLSCKGCKHDCPVQVDMATYKAEFLSHYYEGRLRPRYAYASGLIYWWARSPRDCPATANFFTQTPGLQHACEGCRRLLARSGTSRHSRRRRSALVRDGAAARNAGRPVVMLVAGHLQQPLHPAGGQGGRRGARTRRLSSAGSSRQLCAAAGRCTTTACSIRRSDSCTKRWTRCAARFGTAFRSWRSNRVA